jgi:hypothetical protein
MALAAEGGTVAGVDVATDIGCILRTVMRFLRRHWFIPAVVILDAVLVWAILRLGMVQFGGHDCNNVINHGWMQALGYRPYRDLVTYLPALFVMGTGWAVSLWGMHWSAFVKLAALFTGLTFPLLVMIMRRLGMSAAWSLLLPLAIENMTMVAISWWWYNQTTAVAGCFFVLAALLFYHRPDRALNQGIFITAIALLALSKPNLAGVLLAGVLSVLIAVRATRNRTLLLAGGAAVLDLAVLLIHRIDPRDLFSSYRAAGGRVASWKNLLDNLFIVDRWESMQTLLMLIPVILALLVVLGRVLRTASTRQSPASGLPPGSGKRTVPALIGMTAMAGGAMGMASNGELNISDAPLILLGAFIVICTFRDLPGKAAMGKTIIGLYLAGVLLLFGNASRIGWERLRVRSIGPGMYYEDVPLTMLSSPALFAGVWTGPTLMRVLGQLEQVLRDFGYRDRPDAPVFFGIRLDFAYAMAGIHPRKGIPYEMWDRFALSREDGENQYIKRFKDADFSLCVFFRKDYTYIPQELKDHLYREYSVFNYGDLTLHVRRGEDGLAR